MKKIIFQIILAIVFLSACTDDEPGTTTGTLDNNIPAVRAESTYSVLLDEDIVYADGLAHDNSSTSPFAVPLNLDVYYPDNSSTNRPVIMFIHGGGFTGGTKTKPEIIEMGNYFASRGWVYASIDYRTTEELGTITGMTPEDVVAFYQGIVPQEWIEFAIQGIETPMQLQQSIAMYAAQRDAKAALRWMVANASTYNMNTDFITVGGASAGAVTTIALGISNLEDFRDELSTIDPTLSTTNLDESYEVQSMIYYWGSNVKMDLFDAIYGTNSYDVNDPELFMVHGTEDQNPTTTFEEATELEGIYDSIGIYNELVPLEGAGHGAWGATVGGQGLSDLVFDFLVERQELEVE